MRITLESQNHLTIKQAEVCELLTETDEETGKKKITGVKIFTGGIYECKAVVLCTPALSRNELQDPLKHLTFWIE